MLILFHESATACPGPMPLRVAQRTRGLTGAPPPPSSSRCTETGARSARVGARPAIGLRERGAPLRRGDGAQRARGRALRAFAARHSRDTGRPPARRRHRPRPGMARSRQHRHHPPLRPARHLTRGKPDVPGQILTITAGPEPVAITHPQRSCRQAVQTAPPRPAAWLAAPAVRQHSHGPHRSEPIHPLRRNQN